MSIWRGREPLANLYHLDLLDPPHSGPAVHGPARRRWAPLHRQQGDCGSTGPDFLLNSDPSQTGSLSSEGQREPWLL